MEWLDFGDALTGAGIMYLLTWLLSGVAASLPKLRDDHRGGYIFLYNFIHYAAANLHHLREEKLPAPQPRMRR